MAEKSGNLTKKLIMEFPAHHIINYVYNNTLQKIDYFFGTNLSKPTLVSFRPTKKCDSKCKICLIQHKPFEKELSTNQIKGIILQLRKWLGPCMFPISGGEPTVRKDIWDIIKFANNQKIRAVLCTNGALITKKDIPKIIDSKLKDIRISLDSLNPQTYKKIRGIDSLKKVLQTIDLLKKHAKNTSISINTVITKHNVKEIPQLIEFAKQKKLNLITISAIFLIDFNAKKKLQHVWPDPKNVENIINKVIEYKKRGYPISNSIKHLQLIKKYYKNPDSIKEKCQAPLAIFRIDSKGKVSICNKNMGNVLKTSPEKIWNSKTTKNLRKKLYRCRKSCAIASCYTKNSLVTKIKQYRKLTKK